MVDPNLVLADMLADSHSRPSHSPPSTSSRKVKKDNSRFCYVKELIYWEIYLYLILNQTNYVQNIFIFF